MSFGLKIAGFGNLSIDDRCTLTRSSVKLGAAGCQRSAR